MKWNHFPLGVRFPKQRRSRHKKVDEGNKEGQVLVVKAYEKRKGFAPILASRNGGYVVGELRLFDHVLEDVCICKCNGRWLGENRREMFLLWHQG